MIDNNKLSKLSALGGWCQKMSNWFPFWSVSKGNSYWKSEAEPYEKKNKDGTSKKYGFFERRFYKIFGSDQLLGTMGADNLLQTIPFELGLYNESLPDYNAFVVLAVFKSMLQKKNFTDQTRILQNILYPLVSPPGASASPSAPPVVSQSIFKGLLYTLFTDPKNNMIIRRINSNGTYLFSHGGVNSEIIERNTLQELDDILKNYISEDFRTMITDATLIGGYYKDTSSMKVPIAVYDDSVLLERINNFNSKMKEVLNRIFEEDYKVLKNPSPNILFVLLSKSQSTCKSISDRISREDAVEKCKNLGILNSSFRSTMAGIRELRSKN